MDAGERKVKEILLLPPCLIGYLGKGGSMVTRLPPDGAHIYLSPAAPTAAAASAAAL